MSESMRWRKVTGDFRQHRLQIGLLTLVLSLGTAGVVAAVNARAILKREIAASFSIAKTPDVALFFDNVTPDLLAVVAAEEGVAAVDARRVVFTRVKVKDGTWLPMRLTVMRDFSAQALGVVHLHKGAWPTQDGVIFIEQSGQSLIEQDVGGALHMRKPSGGIATLPVGAFVHDTAVAPSTQDRLIYAYVTPATAALIGQSAALDQLVVKLAYRASFAGAAEFGTGLNAALKRKGKPAFRVDTLPAGHPHAALMNAVVQVLGVFAALALVCSSALAGYLVAAKMRREVAEVGIMKTLGARSHQIALQYLALVAPMVLVATVIGLAAGNLLGGELVHANAISMNIDIASWQVPPSLMLWEIVFALCVPLLAMAFPIVRAARMSARAAIHESGITAPTGALSRLATMLIKFPGNVGLTLSLRNTWRRPWRLIVMVLALACGGALLLMTLTNYQSMMRVIDVSLANQGHDMEVLLQRSAPAAELENVARGVPEVEIAEAWGRASVSLATQESRDATIDAVPANEDRRFPLAGLPDGTRLFKLPITQGRAPRAEAANEVLITRGLRDDFPQLVLGSRVNLQFRERKLAVEIVGVVEQIGPSAMYANFATFDAVTALGGQASAMRIKSRSADIDAVANAVDQAFLKSGHTPGQLMTRSMIRDSLEEHFMVVGEVIRMIAFAAALLGAIVLAATTALNVLERGREIGVIRALGATPRRIGAIFVVEAASVTIVSALLAIAIALPLSRTVLNVTERSLLHVTVPMQVSTLGLALLAGGALVAMLMVLVTVAYALRKPVRDALLYE